MPSSIDGISGDENIAELWGEHFGEIFNCVKSAEYQVGDVINNDGVVIIPDEVCHAIEKLSVNKACGQNNS